MLPSSPVYRFSRWSLCYITLLTAMACSVQIGPPAAATRPPVVAQVLPPDETPTPTVQPSNTPTTTPTPTTAPTATPRPEVSHWTIGLLDEPGNILPFSPDGRAAEPISQAIFPAPVLARSYAYTTTGILRELPTPANGGVERREVAGFLDATGQFTTTETAQPTTTQQLVVTFRWNPALRWADGKAVTAADSAFAYEEARRAPPSPDAAALLELIERYEVVDETTTRATIRPGRIDPAYVRAAWPPLPRHVLADAAQAAREEYAQAPLGYGPYTYRDAKPGTSLTLVRNRYWAQKELPEELRFRFFTKAEDLQAAVRRGEIDVASLERIPSQHYRTLDQDMASRDVEVSYVPGPVWEHIDFNLAEPLLQDVRVRHAVAHAINRPELGKTFFGGKTPVLQSWILPDQPEYAGEEQLQRYAYDAAKARALLDQAGVIDKTGDGVREMADGKAISLKLTTADTPLALEIGRRIERDLRAVGLPLEVQALPLEQLFSPSGPLFRRQFQLAAFAWIASVEPQGIPLWSCAAIPGTENGFTGNNFGGWCFEPAERALRTVAETIDPRARAAAYLRHQRLWTQELPSVPLMQRPIGIWRRAAIKGVQADPLAPITWNIGQWTRDK